MCDKIQFCTTFHKNMIRHARISRYPTEPLTSLSSLELLRCEISCKQPPHKRPDTVGPGVHGRTTSWKCQHSASKPNRLAAATVPQMCIPCCSRPCLVGEVMHGRIAALACKWMSTSHEEHRSAQIHDGACCNLHGEVMHAQRRETADGIAAATPTRQQDNKTTSRQGETWSRFSVLPCTKFTVAALVGSERKSNTR